MSTQKYRYGHQPGKHGSRKVLLIIAAAFLLLAIVGWFVFVDLRQNSTTTVEGEARTVSQVLSGVAQQLTVDEPLFNMELPGDWKETDRQNTVRERSISWQATRKGQENRYLTLYIDTIPPDIAVNRLLPLTVRDNTIAHGDISDNCASFTGGGSFSPDQAVKLKPAIAKWQKVDFICNLPKVTDNQVGTGSEGAINRTSIRGPSQGTHQYFFLYSDRNVQPNYNILYEALQSFRAK